MATYVTKGELADAKQKLDKRITERGEKVWAAIAEVRSRLDALEVSEPEPTPEPEPVPEPTPEPEPTPASITFGAWIDYGRGNALWNPSDWTKFTTNAGRELALMHFGRPWGDIGLSNLQTAASRGGVPYLDVGQDAHPPSAVLAGKEDAAISRMNSDLTAYGKPVLFRPWWEMNGNWYAWGRDKTTAANYVKAWRYLHDRITAPNVQWHWCPNYYFPDAGVDPAPWYPGDAYVDWVGFDGYNRGTHPQGPERWRSPAEVCDTIYNRLLQIAPNKPMCIGEIGSTERGGDKARWITELLGDYLPSRPQIKAVCWFNWTAEGWDWEIESSPSAQAAFKGGITANYYGARFS